jgi:membrane-associated HD superfamily phosphohydrolase
MSINMQVGLVILGWFLLAVFNGIRDTKEECPFWRRPRLLLLMWVMSAIIVLMQYGVWTFAHSRYCSGFELIAALVAVLVTIVGCFCLVGSIGCSLIIPWMSTWDVKNF